MPKDRRALILAQRTHWDTFRCREFLRDLGAFSVAIAQQFQQSVSKTDLALAKAALKADLSEQVGVEADDLTPQMLNQLFG